MQYIDYGLSILSKRIVNKYIPSNTCYDLADCYNALSKKNKLAGYKVKKRFYEIGSIFGLQDFKNFIAIQETGQ
jgi:NDP-sugar pyrophosphorylase family protein